MSPYRTLRVLMLLIALCADEAAFAFGDLGHQAIALVAQSRLTERAAREVDRLLRADSSGFTMRDGGSTADSFSRQATWADYYRENQRAEGKVGTQIHSYSWHFVNVEVRGGTLDAACAGFPGLKAG